MKVDVSRIESLQIPIHQGSHWGTGETRPNLAL